jgi:hypothetical protein
MTSHRIHSMCAGVRDNIKQGMMAERPSTTIGQCNVLIIFWEIRLQNLNVYCASTVSVRTPSKSLL